MDLKVVYLYNRILFSSYEEWYWFCYLCILILDGRENVVLREVGNLNNVMYDMFLFK